MEIKKDKKTNTFSLVGLTEGKVLRLERLLEIAAKQEIGGMTTDMYICVRNGVNKFIAFGTEETD